MAQRESSINMPVLTQSHDAHLRGLRYVTEAGRASEKKAPVVGVVALSSTGPLMRWQIDMHNALGAAAVGECAKAGLLVKAMLFNYYLRTVSRQAIKPATISRSGKGLSVCMNCPTSLYSACCWEISLRIKLGLILPHSSDGSIIDAAWVISPPIPSWLSHEPRQCLTDALVVEILRHGSSHVAASILKYKPRRSLIDQWTVV